MQSSFSTEAVASPLPERFSFGESTAPETHPAGAARRDQVEAGTARSAQGRARVWRGEANPCARAPFWRQPEA